jgi:hypothetical protein
MADLTPAERERIYQEEKARKEAQDQLKKEEATKNVKNGCLGCLGVIGLLILIAFAGSIFSPTDKPTTSKSPAAARPTPPKPAAAQLHLLSSEGTIGEYGYNTVEGQIENISNQPIKNIEAVVTWFDKDGKFISSDSALVEYNPLLAGQTSPFKVMTRTNPEMKRFQVEFKELLGGAIKFEDKSK